MSQRDELTDGLRTRVWAAYCRWESAARSWYELEMLLEREAFGRDAKNRICHSGKWTGYAKGNHVPRARLANSVENLVPGSFAILNHPFFAVCRSAYQRSSSSTYKQLLEINWAATHGLFEDNGKEPRLKRVRKHTLLKLESLDGLDGLAILAGIVLEASRQREDRVLEDAGSALFRAIVRFPFTAASPLRKFAPKIFEVLRERIFPCVRTELGYMCADAVDYNALLRIVAKTIEPYCQNKSAVQMREIHDQLFTSVWITRYWSTTFHVPFARVGQEGDRPISCVLSHLTSDGLLALNRWRSPANVAARI